MSYEVQPGDTLEGVALKSGVRVSQLKSLNRLYSNKLCPGQTLVLRRDPATDANLPDSGDSKATEDIGWGRDENEVGGVKAVVDRGDLLESRGVANRELQPQPQEQDKRASLIAPPDAHAPQLGQELHAGTASELEETLRSDYDSSDNLSSHALWHEVNSFVNLPELAPPAPLRERTFSDTAALLGLDWAVPVVFNWLGGLLEGGATETTVAYFLDEINEEPHYLSEETPTEQQLNLPPTMLGKHEILHPSKAQQLRQALPAMVHDDSWCLLYSLLNDGADLVSFLRLCRGVEYTLMVVQTEHDELFGGFTCSSWDLAKEFCKWN